MVDLAVKLLEVIYRNYTSPGIYGTKKFTPCKTKTVSGLRSICKPGYNTQKKRE